MERRRDFIIFHYPSTTSTMLGHEEIDNLPGMHMMIVKRETSAEGHSLIVHTRGSPIWMHLDIWERKDPPRSYHTRPEKDYGAYIYWLEEPPNFKEKKNKDFLYLNRSQAPLMLGMPKGA